jgi:hypothetical protein
MAAGPHPTSTSWALQVQSILQKPIGLVKTVQLNNVTPAAERGAPAAAWISQTGML